MAAPRPLSMILLASLFLIRASGARGQEIELRRSTGVALTEIDCGSQSGGPELAGARTLIGRIASRIMLANPEVFQGDLSPEKICVVPDPTTSQRAWAEADKRLILIEAGMLLRVKNESQLAFVIAHELAHVALRHSPLEGNPIPHESRERANQILIEKTQVFNLLMLEPKGSERQAMYRRRMEQLELELSGLFQRYFDPEFEANWLETEADVAGAVYFMKAGYSTAELGWRLDQLVVGMAGAGVDPVTQNGGNGFDPHSPPGSYTSLQRTEQALTACRLAPFGGVPPRGTHRYAMPCWQIWNLRMRLPALDSEYGRLFHQASSVPSGEDSSEEPSELLVQVKRDLCAMPRTAIADYCGTPARE